MSSYFSNLPNINVKVNNTDSFITAKNIFRRIKVINELNDDVLGFTQYTVPFNMRPDQVAYQFYGDEKYDWIILICNNIQNLYNDWILNEYELENLVERKYPNPTDIHHYETREVKDNSGNILIRAGIWVNSDFSYSLPDGTIIQSPINRVSNYEYEKSLNDRKANIWLLKPEYVEAFEDEFRELVVSNP